MSSPGAATGPAAPARRRPAVPNAVLGTLVAVVVEVMLFTGLISAFLVAKGSLPAVLWPPPDQPRFPVAATALNTAALLASGLTCWLAVAAHGRGSASARRWLLSTLLLGTTFVVLQGREWIGLLGEGMTLTSSLAGAYFYLLVGAHGLHVLAGLLVLLWANSRHASGRLTQPQVSAVRIYWTFVVGVWPVLYWLVYLS